MKCCICPYAPQPDVNGESDTCPFFDSHYREWNDGKEGCTMTRKQLDKLDAMVTEAMGITGLEMGMQMDFEARGIRMSDVVEDGKRVIGLDGRIHAPYRRYGKRFYKPCQNIWRGYNEAFEYMSSDEIGLMAKIDLDGQACYKFTRKGLDWLGRQLDVVIHDYSRDYNKRRRV